MSRLISAMILVTVCAIVPPQAPFRSPSPFEPGIEAFLSDVPDRIRGKRIGLITNHVGIDRAVQVRHRSDRRIPWLEA